MSDTTPSDSNRTPELPSGEARSPERLVGLRCPECKSDIEEPETLDGKIPQDTEIIECPTCHIRYMRFFWITVLEKEPNTQAEPTRTPQSP